MNNKKILIVDDDPNVLNLSSLILTREGYQVIQAASGAEAINKVKTGHPDMIVVDLVLQDMNGAEIIEIVREECKCNAPAIFLTGIITKKEEASKELDIKVKDKNYSVLAKPIDQAKFIALVKSKIG